jgi:transposase-like protein
MKFSVSQEQAKQLLALLAQQENGFHQVMQRCLEAMMRAEREAYNSQHGTQSNGFRSRRCFGRGQMLELRVPRTRQGGFYPVLLQVLKNQDAEMEHLTQTLYTSGLTGQQIGAVFEEIYGKHYSKAQVSRLLDRAREEVQAWLARPLAAYYPIVFVDAIFVPTRRGDQVSHEAYYTVLAVRSDRRREVLAISNAPTESGAGWQPLLEDLRARGLQQIGLMVGDGLPGLETALAQVYSGRPLQRCPLHLRRQLKKKVKPKERRALQQELAWVFQTQWPADTPKAGWQRWQAFCRCWGYIVPQHRADSRAVSHLSPLFYTWRIRAWRLRSMIYSTNWTDQLNAACKLNLLQRGALSQPEAGEGVIAASSHEPARL